MTKPIKIILWIMCVSGGMAVITGNHGGAALFVSISMICFFLLIVLLIVEILKSL